MSHIKKITPQYFREVKRTIRWSRPQRAARVHGISLSTALNIKGCKNYTEYMQLVKSEHQPTVYSLREAAIDLHKLIFDRNGVEYHAPKTGQEAMNEMLYRLAHEELLK